MRMRDWREASPAEMRRLYDREQEFWRGELAWDASSAWDEIEGARVTWGMPGYLALDDDEAVRGWAYCLVEDGTLHLGGIVSDSALGTARLVDACLDGATGRPRPPRRACFTPLRATDLERVLVDHGFQCEPYHYLRRALTPLTPPPSGIADAWRDRDAAPAADLLREAYGDAGRHFAPGGTVAEWRRYANSLVERPGCGVLEPTITRVVRGAHGLDALVVATRIAPTTLHLAQVAVHPSRRRQGLARRLVEEACTLAAARGATEATLLVGDRNHAARRLYAAMGFEAVARFVAGVGHAD